MELRLGNEINIKNIISYTAHFNNCTVHYLKRVVRVLQSIILSNIYIMNNIAIFVVLENKGGGY